MCSKQASNARDSVAHDDLMPLPSVHSHQSEAATACIKLACDGSYAQVDHGYLFQLVFDQPCLQSRLSAHLGTKIIVIEVPQVAGLRTPVDQLVCVLPEDPQQHGIPLGRAAWAQLPQQICDPSRNDIHLAQELLKGLMAAAAARQ